MTLSSSRYDVLIIGGYGHIGFPMGILLANSGLHVGLYDIDKSKEPMIEAGVMPFLEYDAEPILQKVLHKTLHLVDGIEATSRADIIIITIGTPVDEYLNPKLMSILALAQDITPHLRDNQLVILRSTVFPGTSNRLNDYFREHGLNLHLAFCPERIVQGYAVKEYAKLPQIISGFTPDAIDRSTAVFARLGQKTITVEVLEAELTKLFSNAWRYIQFATANQFYMIAVQNGVDFNRIHHAMTYGYDRARDFPRAGFAAGPCLLKDTLQLAAFYQNSFMMGHDAMLINEGLPAFIVNQLREKFDLQHCSVGILGMAFKADIDDIRDSLSYKLGKLLRFYGAKVSYTDEFAQDPTFVSKEELLKQCDIVIVAAPHSAYRDLVIPEHIHLVDVWGFFQKGTYEQPK